MKYTHINITICFLLILKCLAVSSYNNLIRGCNHKIIPDYLNCTGTAGTCTAEFNPWAFKRSICPSEPKQAFECDQNCCNRGDEKHLLCAWNRGKYRRPNSEEDSATQRRSIKLQQIAKNISDMQGALKGKAKFRSNVSELFSEEINANNVPSINDDLTNLILVYTRTNLEHFKERLRHMDTDETRLFWRKFNDHIGEVVAAKIMSTQQTEKGEENARQQKRSVKQNTPGTSSLWMFQNPPKTLDGKILRNISRTCKVFLENHPEEQHAATKDETTRKLIALHPRLTDLSIILRQLDLPYGSRQAALETILKNQTTPQNTSEYDVKRCKYAITLVRHILSGAAIIKRTRSSLENKMLETVDWFAMTVFKMKVSSISAAAHIETKLNVIQAKGNSALSGVLKSIGEDTEALQADWSTDVNKTLNDIVSKSTKMLTGMKLAEQEQLKQSKFEKIKSVRSLKTLWIIFLVALILFFLGLVALPTLILVLLRLRKKKKTNSISSKSTTGQVTTTAPGTTTGTTTKTATQPTTTTGKTTTKTDGATTTQSTTKGTSSVPPTKNSPDISEGTDELAKTEAPGQTTVDTETKTQPETVGMTESAPDGDPLHKVSMQDDEKVENAQSPNLSKTLDATFDI